jgi:hypothetical protein
VWHKYSHTSIHNMEAAGKLILNKEVQELLQFISEAAAHTKRELPTKEEIARYMYDNDICSRPTTLRIINELLDSKILVNSNEKTIGRNRLVINTKFDFKGLELELISSYIKEIHQAFEYIGREPDYLKDIMSELIKTIDHMKGQVKTLKTNGLYERKKRPTLPNVEKLV